MDSHRNVKMAAELGAAQVGAIYLWIYLTSKCKNDLLFNSRSLCSRSRSLYHNHFLPPTLFFTIKPTEYYSLFDYLILQHFLVKMWIIMIMMTVITRGGKLPDFHRHKRKDERKTFIANKNDLFNTCPFILSLSITNTYL